jgi:hypothetical protein
MWVMKIGVSFSKLVLLSGPAEDGGEGQCRLDQEHPEEPDGDGEGPKNLHQVGCYGQVQTANQLAPLGQQVPQHHTSQITTLIITLHEIKPLGLSHADTDKYWKLVDKILEVRGEYMECMKIGKALLEMA